VVAERARDILASGDPLTVAELALSGQDLLALGVSAGPEVGKLLRRLLELVLNEPGLNTRQKLTEWVVANPSV
jgi:tRNA nucleotidyltransferase (CCA-adding enzyme)